MRWKPKEKPSVYHWHPWFAWYRITVYPEDGPTNVWLETIERRRIDDPYGNPAGYVYRLPIEDEFHEIDNW